jgi:hypothetical protein
VLEAASKLPAADGNWRSIAGCQIALVDIRKVIGRW